MDSAYTDRPDRAKLAQVIRRRPQVGRAVALVMSLVFALVAAPLVMLDSLLIDAGAVTFEEGQSAPVTLRVPHFAPVADEHFVLSGGAVVLARGEAVDLGTAELARAVVAQTPSGLSTLVAYFLFFFLLALIYTTQVRRSHRGRLLRTQAVTLLLLLGVALICKLALMLSPLSVFVIPTAAAAIIAVLVVDVSAGLATGLLASVLIGLLGPFDLGVIGVLGVQAGTAVLVMGEHRHRNLHVLLAGVFGSVAAVVAYIVLHYLTRGHSPIEELAEPLHSPLMATALGGLLSAAIAIPAKPLCQYLLGEITRNKLVELEDLSNPLLRRIAENAPGTWQHSLAMANMAEIAANTIGGSGRLVRVGAYYHDLGKSLQPKYFIENLEPGESSPHDRLPPEVSCDAIFAHVTEGVRLGRKAGLPERIIDFMHTHHGDGLLEYFWAKCKESGNPKNLTAEDFRYPGLRPQSRETAILAICDAVEAASRTLKNPDDQSISNLVQRIVYGKLHLGQLDESGLSMADLRKISNSLRETIKHAHHGRIEYPWQRQEREAAQAATTGGLTPRPVEPERDATAPHSAAAPGQPSGRSASTTQSFITEPRLDSLDVPRPYWRDPRHGRPSIPASPTEPAVATTAAMAAPPARAPALVVDDAVPPPSASPAASAPEPAAAPAPAPEPAAAPAPAPAPVPVAAPAPAPEPEPAPAPVPEPAPAPAPAPAPEPTVAPAPAPAPAAAADRDGDFAEQPTMVAEELVPRAVASQRPPPPGSPARQRASTIELMKEPPAASQEMDDDVLTPGTLVIGPPPATRPERDVRDAALPVDLSPVRPVTIMPRKKRPDPP